MIVNVLVSQPYPMASYIISSLQPRLVFLVCMLILSVAGLGIFVLNAISKYYPTFKAASLTLALWHFTTPEAAEVSLRLQRIAWYKLVLSGVMVACLTTALLVKAKFISLAPIIAITTGVALQCIWILYLLYYWYFVLPSESIKQTADDKNDRIAPNSKWQERRKDKDSSKDDKRLPVTIVTGFLGSGKTTVIKNILQNTIGMKVLVIENEIGEEGVDHDLLMQYTAKEDVILMNNGCICCTGKRWRDLSINIVAYFINVFQSLSHHGAFSSE